jgi:hypothetical protein
MGAIVPFERLSIFVPAVAVIDALMPQPLLVRPLGVEITSPVGKVSVKATPVSGMGFGFVMLRFRVAISPGLSGPNGVENVFVTVGAPALTVAVSVTIAVAVPGGTSETVTVTVYVPAPAYV